MRLGVEAALVDGTLVPGDVAIDAGLVTAVGLDGSGHGIAVPGFVDLQVNGFAGVDFLGADADAFATAGDALLETGVAPAGETRTVSRRASLDDRRAQIPAADLADADPAPVHPLAGEVADNHSAIH